MAAIIDDITYAYAADIVKSDTTEDGHLMVYGKAASPSLDLDGQICDPGWLAQEMPAWFEWANVRAQHGPVAAGVGKSLEADGADGWDLASLIVDTDSKEKVKHQVYKGYSVGIKGARVIKDAAAPNGRVVGGKIVEISLVDRPCNADAKIMLMKSAGSVSSFEDPGDPDSPLIETEILAPTDAQGDVIQPDELTEDEEVELSDLVKGFIEFLQGPKPKKPAKGGGGDDRKRDQGGRFAKQEARLAERRARLSAREKELANRRADVARAAMQNALSGEALADAERARREGRTEEAQEHANRAGAHATDRAARSKVRREYTAIGKGADVQTWGETATAALEYIIKAASAELAKREGGTDLLKALTADIVKVAGADGGQDAIVIPELNKAAEARMGALEASNASLRDELARVTELLSKTAAPDALAPVLVRQTTLHSAPSVVSAAERARREASAITDPAVQRAALAYAASLEAGH